MSKKLVAYFTASGQTGTAAKKIAKLLNCDIYEIKPKTPYSEKDLNWNDEKARSTIECKNRSSRPELGYYDCNIGDDDTIIVVFAVW